METIFENASDTAKKIRAALKEAFPGVKFSVTSSTYSMGSSVYVHWTDGPMSHQVEAVTDMFSSASFDGMQDMKITTGYLFEGKLYNGADYISATRNLSPEYRAFIEIETAKRYPDFNANDWNAGRMMIDTEKVLHSVVDVAVEIVAQEVARVVPEPINAASNVIDFTAFRSRKMQMAAH